MKEKSLLQKRKGLCLITSPPSLFKRASPDPTFIINNSNGLFFFPKWRLPYMMCFVIDSTSWMIGLRLLIKINPRAQTALGQISHLIYGIWSALQLCSLASVMLECSHCIRHKQICNNLMCHHPTLRRRLPVNEVPGVVSPSTQFDHITDWYPKSELTRIAKDANGN